LNREERMELKIPWKEVRVMQRVAQGGHDGPSGPRARRYLQSLKNLAGTLMFVSDARVFDNASIDQPFRLVRRAERGQITFCAQPFPEWLAAAAGVSE
jgi:predicted ABC-type ATPase